MCHIYSSPTASYILLGFNGINETLVGVLVSSAARCPSSICGSFPLAVTDTEGQK